jgi:hypothetical protein
MNEPEVKTETAPEPFVFKTRLYWALEAHFCADEAKGYVGVVQAIRTEIAVAVAGWALAYKRELEAKGPGVIDPYEEGRIKAAQDIAFAIQGIL